MTFTEHLVPNKKYFKCTLFFFFLSLFILRERERESKSGEGAGRENPKQALHHQAQSLMWGHRNCKIMT